MSQTSTCLSALTLAPGASCTWVITYTPTALGEHDTAIRINYGSAGLTLLHVTGSGVAAPVSPVAQPVVTAISPKTGPAAGGTTVTITGRNFVAVTNITAGGVRLTSVSCTSSTKCTAKTPAGHGTVDVRATNGAGTSATGTADRFTYTG